MIEPFNTKFNPNKWEKIVTEDPNNADNYRYINIQRTNDSDKIATVSIYDGLSESTSSIDLNVRQCIFLARMLLSRANEIVPESVPMCITLEHMIHDDNTPFGSLAEKQRL